MDHPMTGVLLGTSSTEDEANDERYISVELDAGLRQLRLHGVLGDISSQLQIIKIERARGACIVEESKLVFLNGENKIISL